MPSSQNDALHEDNAGQTVPGLMQDWPLTLDKIIQHAAKFNGHAKIISRGTDMRIREGSFATVEQESRRLSRALVAHGFGRGDMVATLAWSNDHHLALWYGAPAIGAIIHPLNPRFSPQQLAWILNHAEDKILFFDENFLPLVEAILPDVPNIRMLVMLVKEDEMVANKIGAISLDSFLASGSRALDPSWGDLEETCASGLFYTSGTTGDPKGVLYSHRSTFLHGMLAATSFSFKPTDVVLPVVPMFHANGWGIPHVAPMVGTSLVLPGPALGGAALFELIEAYKVTVAVGVPTMWWSLHAHLKQAGGNNLSLKRLFTGGSAVPRAMIKMFRDDFDIDVVSVWGMTEMSPSGAMNDFVPSTVTNDDDWLAAKSRAGRMMFGVDAVLKSEDGALLPHDGASAGRLMVRGPAVAASYFRSNVQPLDEEGYFDTGDIAVIHPDAVLQITDRAKDLIKSGGEWISSIEMEDATALHPVTDQCAVIGIPHPKWEERPLLVIKCKPEESVTADAIRAFLENKIPKWWLPEEIVFVDDLPLGATGKIDKKTLRLNFKERFGLVGE